MPRLRQILVANRGEIALRIMRSARALGYRTTAVYSTADASAPHVAFADVAVLIGPAPVAESYLNGAAIVQAALQTGADAVHPGYGLLSENAGFARACEAAGLVFIGPRPDTIELMADKRRARIAMHAAGVPCVPGYDGEDQSDAALEREAAQIGFPLMVKATLGGGGRGMRRVQDAAGLHEAIARARSEAQKAFGDGRLILERALDAARHVELQILADEHGHVLHLGERDCSLQRRFQKVIEEAPSPAVDAGLRSRLGEIAVLAAKSSRYRGAGTVELLLARDGACYFLEMNTRLQVEHPVTELVTGIDLVAMQLRVAEGEALPFTQAQIALSGHAIEARLYAEDPARGFLPATGRVLRLQLPVGEGVRVDHGLCEGLEIGPHYDAMLAKVVAHGSDREQARLRLRAALDSLLLLGVQTNQGFLRALLEHPTFISARTTTDWLDREGTSDALGTAAEPAREVWIAAALLCALQGRGQHPYPAELANFTNAYELAWPLALECRGQRLELAIAPDPRSNALQVRLPHERVSVSALETSAHTLAFVIGGVRHAFPYARAGEAVFVRAPAASHAFRELTHAPPEAAEAAGSGRACAPMDGAVIELELRLGERVQRGQTLAIVAAMKLELRVASEIDGVVLAIRAKRGDQVKARQVLVEVGPEPALASGDPRDHD
jgi:geranyl-CoA carboxylase alpha subunit